MKLPMTLARCFGILPRHEQIGDAEATLAGFGMNPSEDAGQNEDLPGVEHDALRRGRPSRP